jgi:biotin synthase-like enzyme
MLSEAMQKYNFETGMYRPPSEGGSDSLLVRFTRNCPWNRCTFCGMYKTEKFELRSVSEIKQNINSMTAICSDLKEISKELGHDAEVTREAAVALLNKVPELNYHQGFAMIYNWLQSGGKTAFLQDANSLIMKTDHLVDVLKYLRKTFPSITRVTSYARSKTLAQKKQQELAAIHKAGLDRLHVGLETGDDDLLKKIKKGVSAEDHIKGGQKALQAGFELSEYWMPGLGGQAMSQNHARNTVWVLNQINPHYIRSRPFYPIPGTPLFDALEKNDFQMLSANEQLLELKWMMEELDVTSKVCFDHAGNYWKNRQGGLLFTHSYEGYKFPEEKPKVLELIAEGLHAPNKRPEFLRL